jgi:hypothetical protein
MTAATTKASEEYPAESQQSESLPEVDLPPSEQCRGQPVPQKHHHFAADPAEDHYPQDRQWSYPNQSLFSVAHVLFLISW